MSIFQVTGVSIWASEMTFGVNALNTNGTNTFISEVTVVKEGSDEEEEDENDDSDGDNDSDGNDDTDGDNDSNDDDGEDDSNVVTFDVNMVGVHWLQVDLDNVDTSTFGIIDGDNLTITCPGSIYVSSSWGSMIL